MTEIRIDGESLDLTEELKIPIDLVNPHLTYESIPNSKATIPNIPFSLRNQRIFEYAEMPQAGNDLYSYDCELIYNGALIYQGKAYVKSANPLTGYQLEVGDDLGRFFGEYQDQLLSDLDLGDILLPAKLTPVTNIAGQATCCFPVILNPDYYGTNGASINYNGIVNDYNNGYTNVGPKVPMLFVNFLLQQIAKLTGVTISGSYLQHPTWSQLILCNWRALDGRTTVKVNDHVPGWTIPYFLLELRKIPNLKLSFDRIKKSLKIDFWEPDLTAVPTVDWTDKAVPGHDKFPEFNRRLQLSVDVDTSDGLLKDKPAEMLDYISAPVCNMLGSDAIGLVKVTMNLSTFVVDSETGLPIAKQTGVTEYFNQLGVSTKPRLLFWHGMIDETPTALPEHNNISLLINGTNGIAETSWKRTEEMRRQMFYLQKSFVLTETDLAMLDFSKPMFYCGLNYLVVQVAVELPIILPATILLVKI